MKTTQLDNEILNHYAGEPKMYPADYPAVFQQKHYLQQGAYSELLITGSLSGSGIVS